MGILIGSLGAADGQFVRGPRGNTTNPLAKQEKYTWV
jgi:hypothetical protein